MEQKSDIFTLLGEAILSLGSLFKKKVLSLIEFLKSYQFRVPKVSQPSTSKTSPNFHEPVPTSWYEKQLAHDIAEKQNLSKAAKEKLESLLKKSKAQSWTGNLGTPQVPGSDQESISLRRSDSSSSGPIAPLTHNPKVLKASEIIKEEGWETMAEFVDSRNRRVIQLTKPSNTIKGAVEARNYTVEEFMKMLKDKGLK